MGKWIFRILMFVSFLVAGYILYSMLEISSGVNVSAKSESNARLLKTPDYKTFGLKKLRLPLESLKDKQISVYYVPHPDDEILTFGVPIRNDLASGKVVYVVLLTHGEISAAYSEINKRITPKKITPHQFGLARLKEFMASSEILGIDKNHKDVYNPKDKKYRMELVKKIALYFESLSPYVTHNGMSSIDILTDHSLIGRALDQLYIEGKIKHKNTYASFYMSRFAKKRLTGKPIRLLNRQDEKILNHAMSAYNRWDPKHGWYACGFLSVQTQFKRFSENKYSILTKE